MRVGPDGELIARLSSSPFSGLSIGISYGGSNIIGYGSPDFYSIPGVTVRFIIIEETPYTPRIICGFDSQGYDYDGDRFKTRAKGVYGLLGKDIGFFALGVGINYSVSIDERETGLFAGAIMELSPTFAFVGDYSLYSDSNSLLAGVRVGFGDVYFGFSLRDITGKTVGRVLDVGYEGYF